MISREIIDGMKKEIELSNIRMSSNDDVEYAVEIIDKLFDLIELEIPQPHPKNCPCAYCSSY